MADDKAFLDGIQQLDAVLNEDAEGISGEDVCEQFRRVKRILEPLLRFIEIIPVYGKTIASAIRVLLAVGDKLCPIG